MLTLSQKNPLTTQLFSIFTLAEDYFIPTISTPRQNNYITSKDATMLLRKLLNMNLELYGRYPEFTEVDMTLQQVVDAGMDEIRAINIIDGPRIRAIGKAYRKAVAKAENRGLKQGVAIGMEKVFALLEKGMSLTEAKKKLSISN